MDEVALLLKSLFWNIFINKYWLFGSQMGNTLSTDDDTSFTSQSIQEIKEDYFISENQMLIHKTTNLQCTLHCILTSSKEEALAVERNIQKYQKSQCKSISRMKEYYSNHREGYCTNQQKYYIIFENHVSPNIKEQYLSRRHQNNIFSDGEIQSILCCMICGMKQYCQNFNRKQTSFDLESVLISPEHGNSLHLKDPWLFEKKDSNTPTPIDFYAKYPSPQKIDATHNYIFQPIDQFSSNLFSIGVYGLQLHTMDFCDDIYTHKKYVDFGIIKNHLRKIRNPKIKEGLSLLLSDNIFERNQIMECWKISCCRQYFLRERICAEYIEKEKGRNLMRKQMKDHRGVVSYENRNKPMIHLNTSQNYNEPIEIYEPSRITFGKQILNPHHSISPLFMLHPESRQPQIHQRRSSLQTKKPHWIAENSHPPFLKNEVKVNFPLNYQNLDANQQFLSRYEGELANGVRNGRGKLIFVNGQVFEGRFENNKAEGMGLYRLNDGRVITGVWRGSKMVREGTL